MITAQHTHFVPRRRRTAIALTRLIAVSATAGLLMLAGGSVSASAAARHVVAGGGRVAGETNAYWLRRSWQRVFDTSAPVNPCQSMTAHGQRVSYLTLTTIAPGDDRYTCSVPAGRPVYVVGLSNECSTFTGDHGTFETTDADLRTCARTGFPGVHETTTIDGRPVAAHQLVAATGAYPVHAVRHNILGLPAGHGRAAAYGDGVLLSGLAKGDHTIRTRAAIGSSTWRLTFVIHAR
jgi:hypothetical protein